MNSVHRWVVLSVLTAFSGASCAKSLDELAPYPCPNNGVCPDGLACVPETGCVTPFLGVPCVSSAVCQSIGATCFLGACTQPCAADGSCAGGFQCVYKNGAGTGTCVPQCGGDGSCSFGLACADLREFGEDAAQPSLGCVGPSVVNVPLGAPCRKGDVCEQSGFACDNNFCTIACVDPKNPSCSGGLRCSGNGYCHPLCGTQGTRTGLCPDNLSCTNSPDNGGFFFCNGPP